MAGAFFPTETVGLGTADGEADVGKATKSTAVVCESVFSEIMKIRPRRQLA